MSYIIFLSFNQTIDEFMLPLYEFIYVDNIHHPEKRTVLN